MLTVVIPTLNAGRSLGACLSTLGGADLLIVDGGSTDESEDIARRAGAHIMTAPRGRGSQLRAGGAAARREWLLFLHADTQLGANWQKAVARHIEVSPDRAGFFDLHLDDPSWRARVIECGVALRCALFALPYGDQGLLISRRLYNDVGGFRPLDLMEDVDLVRRLGRRRLRPLGAPALTSADRWRRDGWLRRSARNLACLVLYFLGIPSNRIARFYR